MSKAAYDLLGFLPVLPGPCGLYRYKDLANGRYQKYFETVNKPAEECGKKPQNAVFARPLLSNQYTTLIVLPRQARGKHRKRLGNKKNATVYLLMRAGLWLANLKIAEDRIPSLFAVFSEPGDLKKEEGQAFETHWVRQPPLMVFSYNFI